MARYHTALTRSLLQLHYGIMIVNKKYNYT